MKTARFPNLRTDEGGWALVTSVALMTIMLVIGMATMASVDFSSQQTRQNRELESALNLNEGVLYAQAFTLAKQWPAKDRLNTAGQPINFPAKCTSAGHTGDEFMRCPNKDNLSAANSATKDAAAFTGVDFAANGSWTTRVRDNYGLLADTYRPEHADSQLTGTMGTCNVPPAACARDFNDDKTMWVEARAVVRGKARKIVALMKLEQLQEAVPVVGITAGALSITNSGSHGDEDMYDVSGASAIVRCTPDTDPSDQNETCAAYKNGQVNPKPEQGTGENFMNKDQIERFKQRAITDGTYYTGCPPVGKRLAGAIVFSEYCQANGSDPGLTYTPGGTVCNPPSGMQNDCTNSIQKPGMVIIRCGGIRISGGTYVGVIYLVNGSDRPGDVCMPSSDGSYLTGNDRGVPSNPQCPKGPQRDPSRVVLDIQNNGAVWGAIASDGGGCIQLGSDGMQVKFDRNVFGAVKSYGTVGLVQNTWRELPPGTN